MRSARSSFSPRIANSASRSPSNLAISALSGYREGFFYAFQKLCSGISLLCRRGASNSMLQFRDSDSRDTDALGCGNFRQEVSGLESSPLGPDELGRIKNQSHFDESSDSGCRSLKLRTSLANSSSITPRTPSLSRSARIARASPTVRIRGMPEPLTVTLVLGRSMTTS